MAEVSRQVRHAARHAAPWVEGLARAGYATRGIVYLIIGYLAGRAAFGPSSPGDTRDALDQVEKQPGGDWMLIALAIGFVGFALWRFVQAALDPEDKGSDPKGLALRARYVFSGLIHCALALSAYRLGTGGSREGGGWYAQALSPLGRVAVGIAALGFLGYGVYQVYRAYRSKLDKQLDLSSLDSEVRRWVVRAARAGITARGVVFSVIGVLLAQAALRRSPEDEPGLQGALRTLHDQPYGRYVLALVAVGLACYGVFELVRARYRRINPG